MFPWIAGSSSAKKSKKNECEVFLWNGLSKDIQMAILARVPLKHLARCRVVCKGWDSLWHSPSFITCCSRSPAEHPWFLFNQVSDAHGLSMPGQRCAPAPNSLCYSPAVDEWLKLSFNDILPADVDRVAATAGGLLFCVDQPTVVMFAGDVVSFEWSTMIVCNPFRGKDNHLRLPPRLWSRKPNVIAMFADPATNASAPIEFKIVLVVAGEGLETYDSRERDWKLVTDNDPPAELPFVYGAAVHKKCIYFLHGDSLVSFDVEKESWIEIELPTEDLKHTQVYSCGGRIFLVGCMRFDDEGQSARLLAWELVKGDSSPIEEDEEWWELSCVSIEDASVAFSSEMAVRYGADDLLMVRGSRMLMRNLMHMDQGRLQGFEARRPHLVEQVNDFLYSVSRNAWYLVLESFGYIDRLSEYNWTSLRFEPRLQASVEAARAIF